MVRILSVLNYALQDSLVLALLGFFGLVASWSLRPNTDDVIKVTLHVCATDLYTLPDKYVGHAIDSSEIAKPGWPEEILPNKRLEKAMKLLSPTYLRFGGIMSDHTIFVERHNVDNSRYDARSAALQCQQCSLLIHPSDSQ